MPSASWKSPTAAMNVTREIDFSATRAPASSKYIVINLRNQTAEVYANPDTTAGTYAPPQIIPADGTLSLRIGEAEMFPLPLINILP